MITYTYDAKDRLTGTRNSRDGVTETTTSDYVYDGKTVTYTEKTWAGETLWNSQKFKRTYLDDALEKVLEERPDDYNKSITWNRRFNMYLEKMKSGNVFEVADVIRTLQVQENEKKLSTGERRLLGTARQILISEVMLVKNAEQQDIENWLNKFF